MFESRYFLKAARSLVPTLASISVIMRCSCMLSPESSPLVSWAFVMNAVIMEPMSAVSDCIVRG